MWLCLVYVLILLMLRITGIYMDPCNTLYSVFIQELEKNSSDTLDYSRLNKDLDGSTTLAVTLDNIEQYENGWYFWSFAY